MENVEIDIGWKQFIVVLSVRLCGSVDVCYWHSSTTAKNSPRICVIEYKMNRLDRTIGYGDMGDSALGRSCLRTSHTIQRKMSISRRRHTQKASRRFILGQCIQIEILFII